MDDEGFSSSRISADPVYDLRTYAEYIDDALNGRLNEAGEKFILARLWHYGDLKEQLIRQPIFLEEKKQDLQRKITAYERSIRAAGVVVEPWKNDLRSRQAPRKKPADPKPSSLNPRPSSAIKPPPEKAIEQPPQPVKQPKPPQPRMPQARVISPPVAPAVISAPPLSMEKTAATSTPGVTSTPQRAVAKSILTPSLNDSWFKAACADCRDQLRLEKPDMADVAVIHERLNLAYAALRVVCKGKAQVPLTDPAVLAAVHKAAGGDRFGAYVTTAFRAVAGNFVSEHGHEVYRPANQNSANAPQSLAMPAVLSDREIA